MIEKKESTVFILSETFPVSSYLLSLQTNLNLQHLEEKNDAELTVDNLLKRTAFLSCNNIWELISALNGVTEYQTSLLGSESSDNKKPPFSIVLIDNADSILSSACGGNYGREHVFIGKIQRCLARTSRQGNCSFVVCHFLFKLFVVFSVHLYLFFILFLFLISFPLTVTKEINNIHFLQILLLHNFYPLYLLSIFLRFHIIGCHAFPLDTLL